MKKTHLWFAAGLAAVLIVTIVVQRLTEPAADRPEIGRVPESAEAESVPGPEDAVTPPPAAGVEWKIFPAETAPEPEWVEAIDGHRKAGRVVALQAMMERRPGETPAARMRLLARTARALAAQGPAARRAFDDLLASPYRDVRLAAVNAFATAFPDELAGVLADWAGHADPVIRAKAKALADAGR